MTRFGVSIALRIACLAASACLASFAAGAAHAQESDPVKQGEQALRASGSFPWYDAERDAVRPVTLRSSSDDARHRESSWEYQESTWNWPDWDLSGAGEVVRFLLYAVLTLVAVAVLALIARLIYKLRWGDDDEGDEAQAEQEVRGDIDRVEALPFPVMRQRGDLLEAARQAYQAGRYDEAIVYYFSYQLVRLDRAQLLRLTRGKTNRQYLREVGWRSPAGAILEPTMLAFEDVFFGRHSLDRGRFESCWNRLDEFHAIVREDSP